MPEIQPKNLAALLAYRGAGNPPNTHPLAAIANCFPGLELDFRNFWKNILVGIELHESDNFVVLVDADGAAAQAGIQPQDILVSIDGQPMEKPVTGPTQGSNQPVQLAPAANLEWTNALALIVGRQGQAVPCVFQHSDTGELITVSLTIRPLFNGVTMVERYTEGPFAGPAVEPGMLTQGLCSPWQADYRECGCYYWATSRPDFVNVSISDTTASGDNWMQAVRGPAGQKVYQPDRPQHDNPSSPSSQWTYEDLYRNWERLQFEVGGQDT